jgi:hypothetical protein
MTLKNWTWISRAPVIPAKAGIQRHGASWIPAFAGMTQRAYFQGVNGGTSQGASASTVLKSAGLTISRYSMSGE